MAFLEGLDFEDVDELRIHLELETPIVVMQTLGSDKKSLTDPLRIEFSEFDSMNDQDLKLKLEKNLTTLQLRERVPLPKASRRGLPSEMCPKA